MKNMISMQHKRNKKECGLTLVELLLYMAIATVLVGLLARVGIQVMHDRVALRSAEDMVYSGEQVMARITRAIEMSEAVSSPTAGEAGSSIVLRMADPAQDPTSYILQSDGRVYEQVGGGAMVPISTARTNVASLTFSNVTTAGMPDTVSFTATLLPRTTDIAERGFGSLTLTSTAFNRFAP